MMGSWDSACRNGRFAACEFWETRPCMAAAWALEGISPSDEDQSLSVGFTSKPRTVFVTIEGFPV